jgi:glycosyltransferase involved in cell wall biosynthesis
MDGLRPSLGEPKVTTNEALRDRETIFFTIIFANYGAHARVLMQDLKRLHPVSRRIAFLVGGAVAEFPSAEDFEVVLVDNANWLPFAEMKANYGTLELATAVKPFCFLWLAKKSAKYIFYLDPDISIFERLSEPLDQLQTTSNAVLTPHRLKPQISYGFPRDRDLLQTGTYNLGFFAVRNSAEVRECLKWWSNHLVRDCRIDLANGLFTDQKWMDLWPSYCEKTLILRSSGLNVAYWNINERKLSNAGGRLLAAGKPLVFFHFSGLPMSGSALSKHQPSIDISSNKILVSIVDNYRARLRKCGYFNLSDQIPIQENLHKEKAPRSSKIRAMVNLLKDRKAWISIGRTRMLLSGLFDPNYYIERYPDVLAFSKGPLEHYLEHGWREMRQPSARFPTTFYTSNYDDVEESGLNPVLHYILIGKRKGYELQPSEHRLRLKQPPDRTNRQICVIGEVLRSSGVGQAARNIMDSITTTQNDVNAINFFQSTENRAESTNKLGNIVTSTKASMLLYCVNVDQIDLAIAATKSQVPTSAFRIIRPFWELSNLPEIWVPSLRNVDEVWAPSRFVADCFAQIDVPVALIPQPVVIDETAKPAKSKFKLRKETFVFLLYFDFSSFSVRKNPLAVIRAFLMAFGNLREDVALVVKCHGKEAFPDDRRKLTEAAARDNRIRIIDETLSWSDQQRLIVSADCFISLFRSEGFGFGPAEAMAHGKPVIATNYSAVNDYLDKTTGFPVSYELIEIRSGEYPYSKGQFWADANIEHAAELMRRVFENPQAAAKRGERGRQLIRSAYSIGSIGKKIEARLRAY